jgi:hypothetical protein
MGWVNFWIPNVGLGGRPVGTLSASASVADTPAATASMVTPLLIASRCTVFLLVVLRSIGPAPGQGGGSATEGYSIDRAVVAVCAS